jgi:hypothetical protein
LLSLNNRKVESSLRVLEVSILELKRSSYHFYNLDRTTEYSGLIEAQNFTVRSFYSTRVIEKQVKGAISCFFSLLPGFNVDHTTDRSLVEED